ncbi:Transcriptional regulator [Streptomyces ambofaciens ATCC 23877]|uniref:Transcriptional regulator n=1 Tax=Streptomyces ambofaciens (strain ATCC 23877 / 3486 / DSM 40053 / JCM 4204 / NBRC 12836 / NRRL B-2516) TaxID=278992 RepID=A0A0K2AYW1_STRA7|nr:Transcriptional regulator [Streptomyces ambofaciens ATCC 23877]
MEKPRRVRMTPGAHRVLEAAERLFYERGIHAVGVDLIAAEAGVTKKTLYDRFGSKEQIVVEYLAGRDERWRGLLGGRLEAAGEEPAARVLAVFEASRAWAAEYGERGCSMVNAHAEISDPAHPANPVIAGQKRWMLDLFTRLVRDLDAAGADGPTPADGPRGAAMSADAAVDADGSTSEDRPAGEGRAAGQGRAAGADRLAGTLMLLHEGALVAHGLGVLPDPFGHALDQARDLLRNRAAAGRGAPLR